MAVLGAQAVVTLIMISFLQKVCPIISLGRWLLTGQKLVRYLHPTNDELRKSVGRPTLNNGGRKRLTKDNGTISNQSGTFTVPRNIKLTLATSPLSVIDVLPLRYYSDIVWLMDFLIATVLVVAFTSLYHHVLAPASNEYGLASIWCLLLMMFSIRPLFSMVYSYKLSQNSGEIVLCVLFGFFFLIVSMVVLIVDDSVLEFHIVTAHENFTSSAMDFLMKRNITSVGPTSLVTFRAGSAIISAIIGALLTFPGIRIAKTHLGSLKYAEGRPFIQLLMHLDFLFSTLLLGLWVPPISRNVLVGHVIPGTEVIISDWQFDVFRNVAVLLFCVMRVSLLSFRLQAHLNTAVTKAEEIRKEAGRISNDELQTSISQAHYYLAAVTLQLIAPVALIVAIILMSFSFTGGSLEPVSVGSTTSLDDDNNLKSVTDQVQEFSVSLAELRAVFSSHILKATTSYLLWWIICAWTVTSYFGMFYHTYMTN